MKIRFLIILFLMFISHTQAHEPLFAENKIDSIYDGKIADPDFKSNPKAKNYRTAIKYAVENAREKGINFSGHYIICSWGCGSPCQTFVIIDAINGKIYDGKVSCFGQEFYKDSKIILLNPPDEDGFNDLCKEEYYIWDKNKLKKVVKDNH